VREKEKVKEKEKEKERERERGERERRRWASRPEQTASRQAAAQRTAHKLSKSGRRRLALGNNHKNKKLARE
jgi:hypothetical protein